MKAKEAQLVQGAADAVRACLEGIPFAQIGEASTEVQMEGGRADLTIGVQLPDGSRTLVVEVKRSGQPRLARAAVNQLLRYLEGRSRAYGVFSAPYISASSAEICNAAGVGYVDLSGNCRLCLGHVYIERTGNPNEYARQRELKSLYAPKASRVVRVLLANPGRGWKVQELSEEADVSLGHASNVKQLLEDREWVSSGKRGLVLTAPGDLLSEWAENYSYRDNEVRDYYCMEGVADIEEQLAAACEAAGRRYALTMFSGAARLGVATPYKRVFAYVEGEQSDVALRVGLKQVPSGANVSLLTPYDGGVFYGRKEHDGVYVPSPVQVFLDLSSFRGRGEETAGELLREVIQR